MSKKKKYLLIFIASIVHFGFVLAIFVSRINCGMRSHCIGLANEIAGYILAFPLGLIGEIIDKLGFNLDLMGLLRGWIIVVWFVNSVIAVTLIWIVTSRVFVSRK